MNKRKKVKYCVTGAFALRDKGEIINAYIILEDHDTGTALLYHPSSRARGECGSIEFAEKGKDKIYRTIKNPEETYINLSNSMDSFFKKLKVK